MKPRRLQAARTKGLPVALVALLLPGISACQLIDASVGDLRSTLGDAGLADRCADVMQRAFPGGKISITGKQAATDTDVATMTAIIAQVQGIRKDVPEGLPVAHDLAVECRFENGILTGFRWTAGPV